ELLLVDLITAHRFEECTQEDFEFLLQHYPRCFDQIIKQATSTASNLNPATLTRLLEVILINRLFFEEEVVMEYVETLYLKGASCDYGKLLEYLQTKPENFSSKICLETLRRAQKIGTEQLEGDFEKIVTYFKGRICDYLVDTPTKFYDEVRLLCELGFGSRIVHDLLSRLGKKDFMVFKEFLVYHRRSLEDVITPDLIKQVAEKWPDRRLQFLNFLAEGFTLSEETVLFMLDLGFSSSSANTQEFLSLVKNLLNQLEVVDEDLMERVICRLKTIGSGLEPCFRGLVVAWKEGLLRRQEGQVKIKRAWSYLSQLTEDNLSNIDMVFLVDKERFIELFYANPQRAANLVLKANPLQEHLIFQALNEVLKRCTDQAQQSGFNSIDHELGVFIKAILEQRKEKMSPALIKFLEEAYQLISRLKNSFYADIALEMLLREAINDESGNISPNIFYVTQLPKGLQLDYSDRGARINNICIEIRDKSYSEITYSVAEAAKYGPLEQAGRSDFTRVCSVYFEFFEKLPQPWNDEVVLKTFWLLLSKKSYSVIATDRWYDLHDDIEHFFAGPERHSKFCFSNIFPQAKIPQWLQFLEILCEYPKCLKIFLYTLSLYKDVEVVERFFTDLQDHAGEFDWRKFERACILALYEEACEKISGVRFSSRTVKFVLNLIKNPRDGDTWSKLLLFMENNQDLTDKVVAVIAQRCEQNDLDVDSFIVALASRVREFKRNHHGSGNSPWLVTGERMIERDTLEKALRHLNAHSLTCRSEDCQHCRVLREYYESI
ncbi:MAG: hypothetical protein NZT61_07525, partial [Deltaproteobacteria bacterium]|nr:hypothetical protein [Deltaproteobacteria bacterium]